MKPSRRQVGGCAAEGARAALALASLVVVLLGAGGCGGKVGVAGATYKDAHPLPPDTLTKEVEEIGTYGGRPVMAQTATRPTFNLAMGHETPRGGASEGRRSEPLATHNNREHAD